VEAEYERIGSTLHVRFWNELLAKYFGLARSALGGDRAGRAWGQGRMAAFDDAVADALRA
jgi:hypothetical protein